MNRIIGTDCSAGSMFEIVSGWTTQFNLGGHLVGGNNSALTNDPRLLWHMKIIGGVKDKRVLELGPLEGAHTKMMIEAGAREVVAIEGLSDCFLRCLIVKEAFHLDNARFIFGDFCRYVADYHGEKFEMVSAAGVLYHQKNPAQLIYDLSKLTDIVIVWTQVASALQPSNTESYVEANNEIYRGKIKDRGELLSNSEIYCASLSSDAFWMYPAEMRRCFKDAGFVNIIEDFNNPSNQNGECLLFVASKKKP
jgi:hypothetical protein